MKEEEEEEAVISNGMNDDDDTNNINSSSEFDNNRIGDGDGDDNCNLNQIKQVWGTWDELVLTCAVKRHAFSDWDSVAKEVQARSRSSLIVSAVNCRLKYQDLKRRFQDSVDVGEDNTEAAAAEEDEVGEIPWLEQLRSLRVAELRREVQRCDDSILSLQLKVKKLEEEKDGDDGDNKPDLKNDEIKPARLNRDTTESDREDNRSMNESNSTASVDKIADHDRLDGDKMVQTDENLRNPDPDPVNKAAAPEEEQRTVSKRSEMSNSGELDESGTSTGPGKRKGQKYRSGGGGGDIKSAGDKSQPLIDTIKLIRSHPRGSVFESRLRSQETKDYKRLIRQHLDIKTIEKKVEKGSYVSSSLSFYRDLKLLFTNAIVFFPTSSSESMAAQELRTLVSNEMKKRTGKSGHNAIKAEAESNERKSSVLPLVACKKKSSASKKTPPSSSSKQKDEKKSQEVSEEKTVTTTTTTTTSARSSRRTSKEIAVVAKDTKTGRAKNNNKKQKDTKTESSDDGDDDEKEENSKTEKKTVAIASDKKKSVADFLKRIKKNSPQKGKETTSKNQKKSDGNVKKENSKAKPRELRSNSTGKKKAEVETNNSKSSSKRKQTKEPAEATGKRGRESEKDNKQPKKRSRR
ncbi:Bromodomain [Arabidopsis suecica]|uniref:Bromodomain n=1 Tax=Arabidopsis suecica TaxID=45249 RepID=A0A8T2A3W0_ARASU|nr:Bromodomain [Arabidopsis suecica]